MLANLKVTQEKQTTQKCRQDLNGPIATKITVLFPKNYFAIERNLAEFKVSRDNLVL